MTKKEAITKLKNKFLHPSLNFAQIQKVKTIYSKVKELTVVDNGDIPADLEAEVAALR